MHTKIGNTYDVVHIVFLELFNVGVNQRLRVSPLNDEFLLALERSCGQQNVLDQCDDSVFFDDARSGFGFLNLFGDSLGRVQQIDFAVCWVSVMANIHFKTRGEYLGH